MPTNSTTKTKANRLLKMACALSALALLGAACSESEAEGPRVPKDGSFQVQHRHDGFPHYVGHFKADVVDAINHTDESSTGGLLWNEGVLFESSGGEETSFVGQTGAEAFDDGQRKYLDGKYSASGLALYNNNLYQLTGDAGKLLVYDADTLEQTSSLSYSGGAWGVCNNSDDSFVMSNGTSQLTIRSLTDFSFQKSVTVILNDEELTGLNELECVGHQIWANISDPDDQAFASTIVGINIDTGEVEATIDASEIAPEDIANDVNKPLNGIAVRQDATLWVTGKSWPFIYQIKLVPVDV